MNTLQAIILGIVQGLTEFIPISSTAHLVFASRWTNIYNGDPQKITATMAVIQLGTLAAVFAYFASDIWSITTNFFKDHLRFLNGEFSAQKPKNPHENFQTSKQTFRPYWLSDDSWLGWLIIIGSIPIGLFGIAFKETIEGPATKNLWIIATMMIVIGILLMIAEKVGSQRKDLNDLGISDALIVGFAQALALIPGASRSGSTIMGGLLAGQKRETAARFSFLLMIPAVTASGLLELREAVHLLSKDDIFALSIGTLVAGIVGYLSIWFLLSFLRKHSTIIFIIYRVAVGIIILVMLWLGIISPQV
ncbi:MAG: UDP-diphosphatase [Acidobacteria bacterium]|jgi:undecaprenyl-diphosphatase|nr:MAG: UDP-diphosphatase [Acidobacteriota bacterium]GIU83208.1 MAG: undecaprenyl-diphosphatase [Pyrinomonadaceae bacterium]